MSKELVYWAIKDRDGKIVAGRAMMLFREESSAQGLCLHEGERPVRVTITEVE